MEQEAELPLPGREEPLVVRQDEPQRADEMRRDAQQHLAVGRHLPHASKRAAPELAQAAVDQRGSGRRRGEIVLLDQDRKNAASSGIACDTGANDATSDDRKIEIRHPGIPTPMVERGTRRLKLEQQVDEKPVTPLRPPPATHGDPAHSVGVDLSF